jgi:hypothetical protein
MLLMVRDSRELCIVVFGEVTQAEINYQTEDIKDISKVAIKYKVNDFSIWVNGFEVGVDTSGSVPTGLSNLSFSNARWNFTFLRKHKTNPILRFSIKRYRFRNINFLG